MSEGVYLSNDYPEYHTSADIQGGPGENSEVTATYKEIINILEIDTITPDTGFPLGEKFGMNPKKHVPFLWLQCCKGMKISDISRKSGVPFKELIAAMSEHWGDMHDE